ncbi:cytochrome b [Vibrio genomosp. F10]|uniref:cytochrome b n=1 Tax=Vibrio genomosp. F10 TaxID=723171 RepID=UPI00036BE9AE|nr:cytochrome b [Vibrio genomosp. F10]OEF10614.1 cytochrome b [Vibrio genomosp. F10 str. 9ZB36]
MSSNVNGYNLPARFFHWVSALTVIGMFAAGIWMVDLSYYSEWYRLAPHWHKSTGILLVLLTALRLIWKILSTSPEIEGAKLEKLVAKFAHRAMYGLLLVIFTSGYLISTEDGRGIDVFGWFTVPGMGAFFDGQADLAGQIHSYAAWTLIVMSGCHALAALKHHFIDKDNTLNKMIGIKK